MWYMIHNWFSQRCTGWRNYSIMETQNDTEPLLVCYHLLSSVGEGLVRSNCTLLIDHVCYVWPTVLCWNIYIFALNQITPHRDMAKELVCMLEPIWRVWGNSKHYCTTLSNEWLKFLIEHEYWLNTDLAVALAPATLMTTRNVIGN